MKTVRFLLLTLLPLLLASALPANAQQSHSARSNFFELDLRDGPDFSVSAESGINGGVAQSYQSVRLAVENLPAGTARVHYYVGIGTGNWQLVGYGEGPDFSFTYLPLFAGKSADALLRADAVNGAGQILAHTSFEFTLENPTGMLEPHIHGADLPAPVRSSGSLFEHLHKTRVADGSDQLVASKPLMDIQFGNRRLGVRKVPGILFHDELRMPVLPSEEGSWTVGQLFPAVNYDFMVVAYRDGIENGNGIVVPFDRLVDNFVLRPGLPLRFDKDAWLRITEFNSDFMEIMGLEDAEFAVFRRPLFDRGHVSERFSAPGYNPGGIADAKGLILLIHGWNKGGNSSPTTSGHFRELFLGLQSEVSTSNDWRVVGYDWAEDANTGGILISSEDGWRNRAEAGSRAAMMGYQHGLHLGAYLAELSQSELEQVHFVAHSAGTWVVYGAVQQLIALTGELPKMQITLLDPYMPSAARERDSFFGQELIDILLMQVPSASFRNLDNYYTKDVTGTPTQVRFDSPKAKNIDVSYWQWRTHNYHREVFYGLDSLASLGHDGPIRFYRDSISRTSTDTVLSASDWTLLNPGWGNSLYYQDRVFYDFDIDEVGEQGVVVKSRAEVVGDAIGSAFGAVFSLFSSSDSAFGHDVSIPMEGGLLAFRFYFAEAGAGDQLQVRINGETIWSYTGTDFVYDGYLTSGEVSLDAYAGQEVEWEFRLRSRSGQPAEVSVADVRFFKRPYNLTESNEPVVSMDAHDRTVGEGSALSLDAVVLGPGPMQLQWQHDGAPLAGATESTLELTGVNATQAGVYRLRAENAFGVAFGPEIALAVDGESALPVITAQPESQERNAGESVSFSFALADPAEPGLRIQWYHEVEVIEGATSTTLQLDSLSAADAGEYSARVENGAGAVTTEPATVTVLVSEAPEILAQPVSAVVDEGRAVVFTAAATGYPEPTYQWRKNGTAIDGATEDRLVLRDVMLDQAGNYDVVVSNRVGSTTSDPATLTVEAVSVLEISPRSRSHESEAISGQTISVSSNVSWSASRNGAWITLDTTSGNGNGTVSYSISANTSTNSRSGTITVTGSDLTESVTVTQAGSTSSNPESWYTDAAELENGWRWFSWFKGFKPRGENWIFHGRHGWLYVKSEETSRMFLWDTALGRWLFTNATVYPWMYAYGPDEGWVWFFEGGRPGSRYFKRGGTGEVISEQQLRAD